MGLSVLWKRILIEHHESVEGLHHWRCYCCFRKSHKNHHAKNNKLLLEKTVSRCCAWLHRMNHRAQSRKSWKRLWLWFQGMGLGEIWELINTTPEELADDLKEMSALEQVPDSEEEDLEEAVPENKWTLDSRAEGFRLLKTAFDFLYDVDSSMIQALKWKQMLVLHSSIFREISKKVRQISFYVLLWSYT